MQQTVEAHKVVRRRGSHIFQDNWVTGGGGVVSFTRRPVFTPRKIPGSPFCKRLNRPRDHGAAGKIRSTEHPMTSSEIEPATFRLIA
jgi:hypothetical protein